MTADKFINLNIRSDSEYTAIDYNLPRGQYINEWEITFERDVTVSRKAEVLNEILEAVYLNNYGDYNKVSAIEYEWCRWSNSPIRYTLYVYRIITPMLEDEKAAFDAQSKPVTPRTLMADDTQDVATPATSGGPQPSGPVLPPPPGVDTLIRKDLVPVTDPPTDE